MRKSAIVLVTLLAAGAAGADQYKNPQREPRTWRFHDDLLVIESIVDAGNLRDVKYFVRITDGGRVVGELSDTAFDVLAASADGSLFVGLSNSGEDPTAVVVFDRQGHVLLQVAHDAGLFDYCSMSVSYIRVWHGSKASDVHFEAGNDLPAITLLDCRGKRVNLLETVGAALARFPPEHRAWKTREKASGQ